ncbi:phosphatase PAP2 family protein [Marinactinospora thermotolerans]|uniref:Undecaprenyl-diphosphatase n=1 Tax=Marinactinospora thermotolerans DSM 45154 TaxID=1122192 RepID=A0A1T4SKF2_9ACTN|nr:phosphatase PAP2 family protein [Marinactinospora thermotolerans]SKA28667.1 undecaprenyl-diphosphatase [Marinactinospora thermotolerans DSM 45154]
MRKESPITRRAPLLSGLALLLAFLLLVVVLLPDVAAPPFQDADQAITDAARDTRSPFLTSVAVFLDYIGQRPWGAVLLAGVLIPLLVTRRLRAALLVAVAWLVTSAVTVPLVKTLLDRERPLQQLVETGTASFPSGHTAYAAVLAMSVVAVWPGRRGWALAGGLLFTALMGWSRIYLGVHWFSDTLAGALIGWSIALLTWWALPQERTSEKVGGQETPAGPPERDRDGG